MVEVHIELGKRLDGAHHAVCPHCREAVALERYQLKGGVEGVPLYSECLRCPVCGEFARHEARWKRVLSACALAPFLLMLVVFFVVGCAFLVSMVIGYAPWSSGFAALGALLVGVAGFTSVKTTTFAWRLIRGRSLLRLRDLQTEIR